MGAKHAISTRHWGNGDAIWHRAAGAALVGSLDEVPPESFGAAAKPRSRALRHDDLSPLLGELTTAKAAAVAFMVATSANWRECIRARREDIDPASG